MDTGRWSTLRGCSSNGIFIRRPERGHDREDARPAGPAQSAREHQQEREPAPGSPASGPVTSKPGRKPAALKLVAL